jgi:OHCU decarboxylase
MRNARPSHPVDEVLPVSRLGIYGVQHVLAFYAGAVVVPILLASGIGLSELELIHLINADLFTCGIASIIQSVGFWKVGVRLPLLQGVTFTAVSPMIAIGLAAGGGTTGLLTIYGSVIVAGLATFLVAPWFSRLIRFFPPVVTGSVIMIIGLALLPVAAQDAVGGSDAPDPANPVYLALALGTLAVIVVVQRVFRGFLATVAVLIGLVLGSVAARLLGLVDLTQVGTSSWVGVTTPFHFGWPQFSAAAVVSMIVVMLITAVETTGDVFATGEIVDKRVGREDVARALRADGLATTLGGILNSFPYTCFAENVGLVRLTGVRSRWVVATAGGFMILLGLVPKAGALVAAIPHPVLGGAALAMFATVAVVGVQTLSRVDLHDHRNVVIVASSLGVALFVTVQPDVARALPGWAQILVGSGITVGSLTAIVLNVVFHHLGGRRGTRAPEAPADRVRVAEVNEMDREVFTATFARLFQGPTGAVSLAYDHRPFTGAAGLRSAFGEALFAGSADEQRALMTHYPDLGGEAVCHGEAGEDSARDQSSVGLTRLADDDRDEFTQLAAAYRDRFGVPLIVCVRDARDRDRILSDGRRRLANSPAQEHTAALIEIAKVANRRLDDVVVGADPGPGAGDRPHRARSAR